MKQDLVTEGLLCLKQKNMRQKAMAQGVCIASSRAVDAAAAAAAVAAPAAAAPAAVHHEDCGKGQATNSACHSAENLVGDLASTTQSEATRMLAVCCCQLSQLHSLTVCRAAYT